MLILNTAPEDFFDLESLQERYDVEFKTALGRNKKGQVPDSFWETYSAMANTEGGYILLGAEEKESKENGKLIAIHDLPEYKQVIQDIWNSLNNSNKVSVNLLHNKDIQPIEIQGKTCILVHIPQASRKQRPVYIGTNPLNGTYQRHNEGDFKCPPELVKRMLGEQTNDTKDAVILENFGFNDIDKESFRVYRQHFSNRKPDHPFNEYGDLEFLRQIGGWARDRHTEKEGLTLAGLLMFGRFRSILDAVPNYIVDYQEREGTETRWIDRITLDGTWSGCLYDFYRFVMKKLSTDLKVPFKLAGDERVEETPVMEALREALVNTLIHADYSGSCSILVVKRPDLYGFRNPGLMRIPKLEAIRGGVSDCRNRNLQKMFQLIGLGEQAGSGFPKIYRNWKLQQWREPVLEERFESNQTVLILKMISLVPEEAIDVLKDEIGVAFNDLREIEKLALVTAHCEECVNHGRLKQLTKEHSHDITIAFHGLVEKGLLLSEGKGRNTFYYRPGHHPMGNEMFGADEVCSKLNSEHLTGRFEHLTGSSEHLASSSEHLISESIQEDTLRAVAEKVSSKRKMSKEVVEATILQLCNDRYLTLEELAVLLKRSKDSLRNHYINPMLEDGRIEAKYKNVRHHPLQGYRTAQQLNEGA